MTTFKIDPYKGMTDDELRARCRALSRAVHRWEIIALSLYEGWFDELDADKKQAVINLHKAYAD